MTTAVYCSGCGYEVDPHCCACGSPPEGGHDNHYFCPMGCVCGYAEFIPPEPRPCHRCTGERSLLAVIDGSAWTHDRCYLCGASWWNDPPRSAADAPLRRGAK